MESDNTKKLKDFFGREYNALKRFVNAKISDTTDRDAEDILQDVALKLFTGAERYAPINNVAGFVYTSIRNKIVDIMRSSKKAPTVDIDSELLILIEAFQQSEGSHSSDEMIVALKKCISELTPAYKDIIIAVDFEGYSYKEIAHETGISIGTLMSRRHRAIGVLYTLIAKEIKSHKN